MLAESPWLRKEPVRLPISRRIADEIFPQKELLKIDGRKAMSQLEALNVAMDLERRSHRFFTELAKGVTDPSGKKIFMDFAEEEDSHLQALLAEYNTLVGNQDRS